MHPVQLFCWHFMAYPQPAQGLRREVRHGLGDGSPTSFGTRRSPGGLFQEYIDQLAYADELGFDGLSC